MFHLSQILTPFDDFRSGKVRKMLTSPLDYRNSVSHIDEKRETLSAFLAKYFQKAKKKMKLKAFLFRLEIILEL